jgi:hypothetical protein
MRELEVQSEIPVKGCKCGLNQSSLRKSRRGGSVL